MNTTDPCKHDDDERSIYGTWATFELELALENGYVITQVTGVCLRYKDLFLIFTNRYYILMIG